MEGAMSAYQADAKELQPEDREKMRRLSEEVQGRLAEMALITTRTLGVEMEKDAVVKFVPLPSDDKRGGLTVQLLERPSAARDASCMCYIDPPGICEPCDVVVLMSQTVGN
jgi:hypothetical protein